MKKLCVIVASLALSLFAFSACSGSHAASTVFPQRGTIERIVSDTGTVEHRENNTLSPIVSGKITACYIEEGQHVEKDDLLFEIDSKALSDQIAQLELAQKNAAQTHQQAIRASEDLFVKSFASGMITQMYVNEGDFVAAGTPVAEVVDSTYLTLTVAFHAQDVQNFSVGMPATIGLLHNNELIQGYISRIDDLPTIFDGNRKGHFIELTIQNPGALKEGELAFAEISALRCLDNGTLAYQTKQTVYAAQSGQIIAKLSDTGAYVSSGQSILSIKNDSISNAVSNSLLALESAQLNLLQAKEKLQDYRITAPAAGIIVTRYQKLGDMAGAGSPLAILAQPDTLMVETQIDELYIRQLAPGQTATVSILTAQGNTKEYHATVSRIHDTGITIGGVTDYTVELSLSAADDALMAGMNVQVAILTGRSENCLYIPSAALMGNQVRVLQNGKEILKTVDIGLIANGQAEIISGLSEEDAVILP